jgi:hypothetical protein
MNEVSNEISSKDNVLLTVCCWQCAVDNVLLTVYCWHVLLFNSSKFCSKFDQYEQQRRNSRASQDVFSGTQKERGHAYRGLKCQENEGGKEVGEQSRRNEVVLA